MPVEPNRGIGAGRTYLTALFMDLVDSHLHQFRCDPLPPQIIVYIGVVDRVNARLKFRECDLCKDPAVFVLALYTVGKSDILHAFFSFIDAFRQRNFDGNNEIKGGQSSSSTAVLSNGPPYPLYKVLVIDRTASSDKLRAAAGTDDGGLTDFPNRNAQRYDDRTDMHADQRSSDIDPG